MSYIILQFQVQVECNQRTWQELDKNLSEPFQNINSYCRSAGTKGGGGTPPRGASIKTDIRSYYHGQKPLQDIDLLPPPPPPNT